MSIITDWPKNAVYPTEYKIDTRSFGKPFDVSKAVDLIGEIESLFDIDQAENCLDVFVYLGGTCSPHMLREHLPRSNGYEHILPALDSREYIHRIEIARKVSWEDFSTVAVFDRIPELSNVFAITNNTIRLAPSELNCFKEILAIIASLPGRIYVTELPELPLIALINEMNGKV